MSIEPFRYRFQNPGIEPLSDAVWFKSHQELLLNVVNTEEGRGLLRVDKSFEHMAIIGIGANHLTGLLGCANDKAYKRSTFSPGLKWGNIIRKNWPAFQKLAREHYSHKKSNQCRIRLHDEWLLAATTSTFFPSPFPFPPVDGFVTRIVSLEPWATMRAGAGTAAFDASTGMNNILFRRDVDDYYSRLDRSIALFDTAAIGTDNITSATASRYLVSVNNTAGGENSERSRVVLCSSNPASDASLVASDYNIANHGSVDFGRSAKQVDLVTSAYNPIVLNASGLAAINKSGITKFSYRVGWDFDNNTSGLTADGNQFTSWKSADEIGLEPELEVVHFTPVAGGGQLINGGLINTGLTKGRLAN